MRIVDGGILIEAGAKRLAQADLKVDEVTGLFVDAPLRRPKRKRPNRNYGTLTSIRKYAKRLVATQTIIYFEHHHPDTGVMDVTVDSAIFSYGKDGIFIACRQRTAKDPSHRPWVDGEIKMVLQAAADLAKSKVRGGQQ
jgi:hypothetical protein